jgi:protein SCO1
VPVPAERPFAPPEPLDPFRPPAPQGSSGDAAPGAARGGAAPDDRADPGASQASGRAARIVGALLLAVVGLAAVGLVAAVALAPASAVPGASSSAVEPAPPLELTDQDGQPFRLASLLGRPVLVFFGYTHCPDVCPATVGTLNEALARVAPGPRAVFVSIDPERDDPAAMKSYLQYLPPAYTGLTGSPAQVRQVADAWGIRYAKQVNATGGYAMAHTADVFLVDAQGRIRTRFPFGTTAEPIETALTALLAEGPPPSGPPVAASAAPSPAGSGEAAVPTAVSTPVSSVVPGAGSLQALVVSSEVWAGGPDPIILTVADAGGTQLDGTVPVDVTVTGAGNAAAGPPVRAVAVKPWGEKTAYYVATVTIPSPGGWRLALSTPSGASGTVAVTALDQGATTPLGAQAPNIHTPTLADVGGVVRAVTTQPQPDLRLSQTSTSDARAQGKPYVIVIDSARFRVSPLCGKAIVMVRYLVDRWGDSVDFIHLEPFTYTIVTEEPVLSGDIANPPLNQWAQAYGLGPDPWGAKTVPWAFVVDGSGLVRAKYEGVVGSADLDVIISLIENNGVIAGG